MQRAAIELSECDEVSKYCPLDFNDVQEIVRRPAAKTESVFELFAAAFSGGVLIGLVVIVVVFLDTVLNH